MWNYSLHKHYFLSRFKNKNENKTQIFGDKIFPRPETVNKLISDHLCLVCEAVPYLRFRGGTNGCPQSEQSRM